MRWGPVVVCVFLDIIYWMFYWSSFHTPLVGKMFEILTNLTGIFQQQASLQGLIAHPDFASSIGLFIGIFIFFIIGFYLITSTYTALTWVYAHKALNKHIDIAKIMKINLVWLFALVVVRFIYLIARFVFVGGEVLVDWFFFGFMFLFGYVVVVSYILSHKYGVIESVQRSFHDALRKEQLMWFGGVIGLILFVHFVLAGLQILFAPQIMVGISVLVLLALLSTIRIGIVKYLRGIAYV